MHGSERVLLITDERATRLTIGAALQDWRTADFCTVETAHEGLAYLVTHSVSTLIADLGLRYGGGFHVLNHARALKPALPVLVLLERGDRRHAAQAVHEGASDLLWKPVQATDVERAVRCAVQTYRLRQRLALAQARIAILERLVQEGTTREPTADSNGGVSVGHGHRLRLSHHALRGLSLRLARRLVLAHQYAVTLKKRERQAAQRRLGKVPLGTPTALFVGDRVTDAATDSDRLNARG